MASTSREPQEHDQAHGPSKVKVTILASEWGSSKGGLSTINRELAIQLAKFPEVEITFFVPQCSEEDKNVALSHNINIVEATRRPGFEELEWLSFPPEHLQIDVVVGHGVKLGHQAQVIRESRKCKWVQVVHTDPEELGMFKSYPNPISKGEEKHNVEVELCEMANFVVGVGPKLSEAFRTYLRGCRKDQTVLDFTPGIFDEFGSVKQVLEERQQRSILVFGRGDAEDFELKGFDIAARAVASLPDTRLVFVGAPDGKQVEVARRLLHCKIPFNRLKVRRYVESRDRLKQLFCEVDLVLMPSRTEGFGLTGLEALSAGLPVLVSKNSGFGEALSKVPFGSSFVVDSEDPKVWAAAINNLWSKNRKTRLEEAETLRDCYEKEYSWAKQSNNLLDKITSIITDVSSDCRRSTQKEESEDMTKRKHHAVTVAGKKAKVTFHFDARYQDELSLKVDDIVDVLGEEEDGWWKGKLANRTGVFPSNFVELIEERDDVQARDKPVETQSRHPAASSEWQNSIQTNSGRSQSCELTDQDERMTMTGHHADPMVTNIIERIRLLYKTCEERLLPVPWSEDFSFHLNDIFTRLKIVSKEKTRGTLTDDITNMTGIFKEHEDCQKPRIVLIEGEPGMGKTTYCQKLAYDWATKQGEWDQSFPNTEVLLFLRCHDIKSNIWEAINDQILPEDIDEEAKESFNKFIRQNQSKVLLVLDGLDEVDRSKLAMCSKIVESKELSDCHIILTSRHEAGKTVRRYCDTLWEIVGFTEKDAQNFIRKYFRNMENLAKKLITLLFGQHLCLYGYDSDYDTDEETDYYWDLDSYSDCDTNQYSHLRELTKNPLNTVLLCVLFEDFEGVLPTNRTQLYIEIVLCVLRRYEEKNGLSSKSEDLIAVYRKELVLLGSTALLSLRKGELSCEEHEFGCDFSLLIKFGFLSVQTCGSQRKPFMRCAFLHKSFQEFFSGLYLAFQVLDGEMDCYSVVTDERYLDELNQVFLFMSGIVASQCEESALSLVKSTAAHINLLRRISCDKANLYLQFACDFISECQEKLQPRLFRNFYEQLDLSSLTNLNLHGNSFGATVATFLSQVLTATSSLTSLNLSGNSIGATGTASLSQALAANSSVTNLNLSENSIGATGAASLSQALTANCSLTNLNLSWNSIDATGAASLSQALEANASLTHLNLSWNSIGDTGAASLSQALTENSSLTNLDLSYNSIGATGAASLSQGLTANSSLTDLNLCENNIGDDGAYSLSEALTTNSSLTSLDLSGNGISETGVDFLSNVLIQNSSLSHLDLSENEISTDGIRLLSGVLRINTTVHVIL